MVRRVQEVRLPQLMMRMRMRVLVGMRVVVVMQGRRRRVSGQLHPSASAVVIVGA